MVVTNRLPEVMTGYQTLAWIAWRNLKAVKLFSGDDAEELWERAKRGSFPRSLGKPMVTPIVAERELGNAIDSGDLPITRRSK